MSEVENMEGQSGQGENNGQQTGGQDGVPLVFLRESAIFGQRKPLPNEWLKHEELYNSIGTVIDCGHIAGLQRVNGLWRIYLDNLEDKVSLMTQGVPLRGKTVPVLRTNPNRADGENTMRVRVKNVPLSADDNQITRVFTLKGIDVISVFREKLRINGKLTNCATGDRIFVVKSLTLKEPLPIFMEFGRFRGRVIHQGQVYGDRSTKNRSIKCSKCLEEGHRFAQCENDWRCRACNNTGHKEADCKPHEIPPKDPTSSESEIDSEHEDGTDGDTDESHSTTGSEDEKQKEPVPTVIETPVRVTRRQKKVKAKKSRQTTITSFVAKEGSSNATPDKASRARAAARSPPTPAEQLHDNSKKAKS